VSAMIEAAEVLTPEQRAKLAAEMNERHGGRW
jgi:Spy/CpxP family protein refolding chaperone